MHELAIAQSIFENAARRQREDGYLRIQAIGLRVGALTDLVPDSLEFGFRAMAHGTPLEETALEIERVLITGRCNSCGTSFSVDSFAFVCPDCESRDITLLSGNELEISYFRVEEEDDLQGSGVRADDAQGKST